MFFVFAVLNAGHNLAEGESAVDAILRRLKEKPLSPKELQKAKNQLLFELASDREKSKNLAEQLGYDTVILNNPELINTEAERFLAVTAEQVQAAARKYFVRNNLTLLEVHPGKNGQMTTALSKGER